MRYPSKGAVQTNQSFQATGKKTQANPSLCRCLACSPAGTYKLSEEVQAATCFFLLKAKTHCWTYLHTVVQLIRARSWAVGYFLATSSEIYHPSVPKNGEDTVNGQGATPIEHHYLVITSYYLPMSGMTGVLINPNLC